MGRIDVRRLQVEQRPVVLPELLAALLTQMAPTLSPHRVDLLVDHEVPPINADPVRLEQIFTNLVENAAKHSRENATILVRVGRDETGVRVTVEDSGVGIAPDELPRLFERYYRAPSADPLGGLGLGLYISKHLVEAQGGRIWVESAPGKGTTFFVWFPLAQSPEVRSAGNRPARGERLDETRAH
jgi:two-component system phosphate regulon sensor histidine kinase PhoR